MRCRARDSGRAAQWRGHKTGSTAWVQAAGLASSRDAIAGCVQWARPETQASASLALQAGMPSVGSWPRLAVRGLNLAMLIAARAAARARARGGCQMPKVPTTPGIHLSFDSRPCEPHWASSSEGRARSKTQVTIPTDPTDPLCISSLHLVPPTNTHRTTSHRPAWPWPPVTGPSRSLTDPGLPRCSRPELGRLAVCSPWPPSICDPEAGSWGHESY